MKIDEGLAKYKTCRIVTEGLVYISGISPHRGNASILYKFIAIYGLFILIVIATKGFFEIVLNMGNISKMIYGFREMAIMAAPIVRMVSSLSYQKEFIHLEKELSSKFDEELENEKHRALLLKKFPLYRTFIYFMIISTHFAVALYLIQVAIAIFKYKKYIPLFPGKYPFPVEPGSTVYWAIVAMELTSLPYVIFPLCGVDTIFGMHCFRIRSFLRLSAERFQDLNAVDPNCSNKLRECVSIHQLVLRAKVVLENAYSYTVIWNYLASAILMCCMLYDLDQNKDHLSVVVVTFALTHMLMKLSQTFIYAYFGSSIITESEEYQNAVYTSSWPGSGNLRLMKELLIVLVQRPINLKACGFFLITMQYFEKICHATISYFFLIQVLDEKN